MLKLLTMKFLISNRIQKWLKHLSVIVKAQLFAFRDKRVELQYCLKYILLSIMPSVLTKFPALLCKNESKPYASLRAGTAKASNVFFLIQHKYCSLFSTNKLDFFSLYSHRNLFYCWIVQLPHRGLLREDFSTLKPSSDAIYLCKCLSTLNLKKSHDISRSWAFWATKIFPEHNE